MEEKRCPQCGEVKIEEEKFCKNCGYKLEKEEVKSQEEKINNKNKSLNIIVILILAIVLVIFVVSAFVINNNSKKDKNDIKVDEKINEDDKKINDDSKDEDKKEPETENKKEISSLRNKMPKFFDTIVYLVISGKSLDNEFLKNSDDRIRAAMLYIQLEKNNKFKSRLTEKENEDAPPTYIIKKDDLNECLNLLFGVSATDTELKNYFKEDYHDTNIEFGYANGFSGYIEINDKYYCSKYSSNPYKDGDKYILTIDMVSSDDYCSDPWEESSSDVSYNTTYNAKDVKYQVYLKYKELSDNKYVLDSFTIKKTNN